MNVKKEEKKHGKFYRTLIDFGKNTSFHGVKYAISEESTIYEKIFWILIVMLGFCGAIYMTMIFWNRFSSNPIRITIQPVHKQTTIIPFPGVTICTAVRQIPRKVDRLLESLTLPEDITVENVKEALPVLMGYTQPIEVDPKDLALLDKVFPNNSNYTVQNIFAQIEPDCNDLLLKCRWEQQIVPCSKIFTNTLTHDGHCCSFNSQIGSQNLKIKRTLFYGAQMGLSVILNPETSNNSDAVSTLSSTGIKVLIHSPEDYPGISSIEKILGNGTETYMRILGTKLVSSDSVKSLTAEQRNCLFEDERHLEYFPDYRDTNCGIECRMNSIFYYCECIPFTYPKTNKRVCGIMDIACMSKNYNAIYRNLTKTSGQNDSKDSNSRIVNSCDCPSQCNDVFYAVQTSSIPTSNEVPTISNFYNSYIRIAKNVLNLSFFGALLGGAISSLQLNNIFNPNKTKFKGLLYIRSARTSENEIPAELKIDSCNNETTGRPRELATKLEGKGDNIIDRMTIHVYFGSYYQTEMLRDTITSTYYLLSSFGGVFSLFLGCSFLSVLEILYFFCYRIFTKYND